MSKIDYIIEKHIKRLGIKEYPSLDAVYAQFSKKYGGFKTDALMQSLCNNNYELMYSDYDIAMIWGGAHDYNLLKHFYEWVYNNTDKFGPKILEIGCGCGFMTTFLASVMPDKEIFSIDISKKALDIAEKNVKKLGLKNVEFLQLNLDEIKDQYDTVFSCRTMMENVNYDINADVNNEIGPADGFIACANLCFISLNEYASLLKGCLNDTGTIISIEKIDRWQPEYYAWLKALYNNGLSLDVSTFEHNFYKRLDDYTGYDIGIFNKANEKIDFDLNLYVSLSSKYMNLGLNKYQGWEAQFMFDYLRGDTIKSDNKQAENGTYDKKDIVTKDRLDDSKIIHFTYDNATTNASLIIYPTASLKQIIRRMNSNML